MLLPAGQRLRAGGGVAGKSDTVVSQRIDKSWTVFVSVEHEDNRCVYFFSRPDGNFGFEEFRRDMEDGGR